MGGSGIVLACVIDGHGGHSTAVLAQATLVENLVASAGWNAEPRDLEAAITQTFDALDAAARGTGIDGACCVLALIVGASLVVGWVGDSAAALLEAASASRSPATTTRTPPPKRPAWPPCPAATTARPPAISPHYLTCSMISRDSSDRLLVMAAPGPDGKLRSYGPPFCAKTIHFCT